MALVAPYTNTRSRNLKRMHTRSGNNDRDNTKLKDSINFKVAIPALNFPNGIHSGKGALGSLTGVMSEKNGSNIISSTVQRSAQISKKESKKKLTSDSTAYRKSMRLLIRKRGTTNLSGNSTCTEIPQPITMPRTVEFFTDVHNISQDKSQQSDGLKLLFLAGLGLYPIQHDKHSGSLGMDYQRQILQEECDKFRTSCSTSSYDKNDESSLEDNVKTINNFQVIEKTLKVEAPEVDSSKLKCRNESANWDVNMTVVITPVVNQLVKTEYIYESDECYGSSCNYNEDEFIASSGSSDTSNVNDSDENDGWQSFGAYMKDQLAQTQLKCTPEKISKQEIKDAKRKLVKLQEQWSCWKGP